MSNLTLVSVEFNKLADDLHEFIEVLTSDTVCKQIKVLLINKDLFA